MKYILRLDNGTIKSGNRCKDEPRYHYLTESTESVDMVSPRRKDARIFTDPNGVKVHSHDWKIIVLQE